MIDILLDINYDLQFSANGDLVVSEFVEDARYQDLSILLNIDRGHNKQYPEIGVAIYRYQNGVERELFSEILRNAELANINIKRVFLDDDKKLQIIL